MHAERVRRLANGNRPNGAASFDRTQHIRILIAFVAGEGRCNWADRPLDRVVSPEISDATLTFQALGIE